VELICPQAGWWAVERLERVPRSHVWFRTFKVRNDCYGTYGFLPNPRPTRPGEELEYLRLMHVSKPDPLNRRV